MVPAVPLGQFATPIGAPSALPLAPGVAPIGPPPVLPPASATTPLATPSAISSAPAATLTPVAPPIIPSQPPAASTTLPTVTPASVPAPSLSTVQQAPGSGQQMFKQMFALLKQMLPAEQYATLHSEMRKGNGNDIKSIVDIIKRIAGDAIFSSVIQKMDLTRSFPANTPTAPSSFSATVKNEPTSTLVSAAPPTAIAPPSTLPVAAPTQIAPPTSALLTPTITTTPAAVATTAAQRPTLLHPDTASSTPSTTTTTATTKTEPETVAASAPTTARNEALEKIMFAKKLLTHAAACVLSPGLCQVKRCDDIRRVFKHTVSCGGARGCPHCEQLKGLVKYHAKECSVAMAEHCPIPFCDGFRRAYAAAASTTTPTTTATTGTTPARPATTGAAAALAAGSTSDDDDDNAPLSAVSKAKKTPVSNSSAKGKSPKASPSARNASASSPSQSKKKASTPTSASASKPVTPATTATTSTTTTTETAAKGKNVTSNATAEYGRLLQLILHVQKCTSTACPIGEDCAESKSLLRQINSPNAPVRIMLFFRRLFWTYELSPPSRCLSQARAKTYKQVYSHYKVCLARNTTATCPMCKIGLQPIAVPSTATTPLQSPGTQASSSSTSTTTATASTPSATSPSVASLKRSSSSLASPRSPSKKPRTGGNNRLKSATPLPDPAQSGASDPNGNELVQANVGDIRKEADVLTHTGIELSTERRVMMDGVRRRQITEQLPCKKEEWVEKDLFNSDMLKKQMRELGKRCGVTMGEKTSDVMAYALHEYLKQVIEEMVEISKQRCDSYAQALDQMQRKEQNASGGRPAGHAELTATDILRVSCEDSFSRLRQEDLALRTRLLEDAKREEQIERERAKKRKKVDRSKLAQEEKDEAEMDMEELATKDLKERLLQEDKDGIVKVDGRVNESISSKFIRRIDNQVTTEDAYYWLQSQKPYVNPKLFVRAEAARIVTKSLL
ncbi:TPA: hypothetical protein N0F65_004200 [Lagenidium giganteum]|uniref:histone acetyltransferase n=1 Tax=Lagenidium giganteum TaxID=4803 RepID=A0AAV2YL92_9STRA|nr:TPA: hypothetical protein N0F65_004200 [Lagenidium giganteum]